MRRTKSIARRSYMVVASSSSREDDMSLGADQGKASAATRDTTFSSVVS
jgi:hypothetical protein